VTLLLAVDPGTITMGLALFDGPDLEGSASFNVPEKWLVENRLTCLMLQLKTVVRECRPGAIAMERPGAGNPAHRPASLLTLCTFIRQAARSDWKIPCAEYATGTITAAVRLRGWPGNRKVQLLEGVCALYGEHYRKAPQDVVDAIAVGHTYLVKQREIELLGRAETNPGHSDQAVKRVPPLCPTAEEV
jgi:Holliday junction resolvasome RuvABC endonuclease subunit